jgi:hypothetical protein
MLECADDDAAHDQDDREGDDQGPLDGTCQPARREKPYRPFARDCTGQRQD